MRGLPRRRDRYGVRRARVAESVDAGGLNPPGSQELCGFDPHPGHHLSCVDVLRKHRREFERWRKVLE